MYDIDLVALVAVFMGISVVLVPVMGLTARFALKPTVEALAQFFEMKGDQETVRILERRVALLEQQLEGMDRTVRRLDEVEQFERRLHSGPSSAASAREEGP